MQIVRQQAAKTMKTCGGAYIKNLPDKIAGSSPKNMIKARIGNHNSMIDLTSHNIPFTTLHIYSKDEC
jgi:hypothetical protein